MTRKLLAMDLDGTAVKDDYSMEESTIDAIRTAQASGHVTAFVSGRRDVDMLSINEQQWAVDYHILNNGGKIIRCKDKTVIRNEYISKEVCKKMIRFALDQGLQLHILSGLLWQVTRMTDSTLQYAKTLGVIPETIDGSEKIDFDHIEGFMATADWKQVADFIDEEVPELVYVHSEPGTIDIMKAGVSKFGGIKELSELLDIPLEDTIAVGNYYNDIDMIRKAGTGIAVANSVDEAKLAADYVTENDNEHGAIAEIIEKMLKGDFDHERKISAGRR